MNRGDDDEIFPIVADSSRQAGTFAIQIHPEQQRINQYVLAEMAKLKRDNKRLNDEVLALRMENMQLNSRISTLPTYGLPIEYPGGGPSDLLPPPSSQPIHNVLGKSQQELPFVEFDMRRSPPTVQSANVMFCSLLGYSTEEVLGKPWQYFIQDEYVERTIRMLQRDAGTKQMQFGQVYKDRHGRPVPAQDLHTFNRDEKGRVITDYVIVRPEGAPSTSQGAPLAFFGGVPNQQIAQKKPLPSIMGGGDLLGTSPLMMMDESGDDHPFADSPSPPPPPMIGVSGDWNLPGQGFMWEPEK